MPIDINSQVTSSVTALEKEFNAIAHNLANVNTVGYKRITTTFSKALSEQSSGSSDDKTSQAEVGQQLDLSQGLSLLETGRTLDLALFGNGFFEVESPEGPLYTRNGSFKINQNGQIVDSTGKLVSGESGPITISADIAMSQVNISHDGTVSGNGQVFGKLKVVEFGENDDKIIPTGDGCYAVPEDVDVLAAKNTSMRQGCLESSNVKMVDELVSMIMVSRLYEANMKFMNAKKEASSNLMSVAMG
jgi:flagellar basal body rod protein FlgG